MTTRDAAEAALFCKDGIELLVAWMNTKPGPRRDRSCYRKTTILRPYLALRSLDGIYIVVFLYTYFLGCSGCGGVTR